MPIEANPCLILYLLYLSLKRKLLNLLTTLKGSLLENFFPAGWDLAQWDACVADDPKAIFERQPKWHKDYSIRMANSVADFDVMLGS